MGADAELGRDASFVRGLVSGIVKEKTNVRSRSMRRAGGPHEMMPREARATSGVELWDGGVAQYVADRVRPLVGGALGRERPRHRGPRLCGSASGGGSGGLWAESGRQAAGGGAMALRAVAALGRSH